jgi:hypothetical protein
VIDAEFSSLDLAMALKAKTEIIGMGANKDGLTYILLVGVCNNGHVYASFRVCFNQSILDANPLLKELRGRSRRKPVWTEESPWYPDVCE